MFIKRLQYLPLRVLINNCIKYSTASSITSISQLRVFQFLPLSPNARVSICVGVSLCMSLKEFSILPLRVLLIEQLTL